ncbi:MAG: TIGR01777 family oxidoreductase [Cyclobacteriaceae bacterium]
MANKILITGGTGLVGARLKELWLAQNKDVALLSRSQTDLSKGRYNWDIKAQTIDQRALEELQGVVHLAGAGVADGRWTDARKKAILDSRIQSTNLLYDQLKGLKQRPKVFVSASAIGIYGYDTGDTLMTEESPAGDDFLADVVKQWEAAVDRIKELGIRVVKLRIGIVLAEDGGALPKMVQPIRLWAGAPLGSGQQYMSWIHIDDLCQMMLWSLAQDKVEGTYNAVGPNPATNAELTKSAAQVLSKPLFLPNVPGFVIKLMFGEMGNIVLGGNNVSNQKMATSGFKYQFEELESALKDLLN